jgi:putative endonuclease
VSRVIGSKAEDVAVLALEKSGYKIIERNYFARVGEIDIIATKDNFICFIEVKERAYSTFGGALAAIAKTKLDKILLSARKYLHEKHWESADYRIDAVIIEGDEEPKIYENIYIEGM